MPVTSGLSPPSPGPPGRRYYDLQRERHKDHDQALRALANRLVGILDGCLRHRDLHSEAIAWERWSAKSAA